MSTQKENSEKGGNKKNGPQSTTKGPQSTVKKPADSKSKEGKNKK